MENYPRVNELLTVMSVGKQSITVKGAGGLLYSARCIPKNVSLQAEPLEPGHDLQVTHVNHGSDRGAVVERIIKGSPDGCDYMLYEYVPLSK